MLSLTERWYQRKTLNKPFKAKKAKVKNNYPTLKTNKIQFSKRSIRIPQTIYSKISHSNKMNYLNPTEMLLT